MNVSDTVGSYLLYALSPELASNVRTWKRRGVRTAVFEATVASAEAQLAAVLKASNLTVLELYHALAIPQELKRCALDRAS